VTDPAAARPAGPTARPVVEAVGAFVFATAVAAALYRVRALDGWFHAVVAALFLYVPAWLLRRHDLADFGLTARPVVKNLALYAATVAIVLPLFALGFLVWHHLACALPQLAPLAAPCGPPRRVALRLPPDFARLALAEVLVVALPEEFFFRGYLQERLAQAWPARAQLFGAPVGAALVVASALFALCHLAVQGNPATLAVFFPGLLFGWMRARSGSILPGTLFHASCNLYMEILERSLFG
jgi:membrane protease YdiL (CAAX protease family)